MARKYIETYYVVLTTQDIVEGSMQTVEREAYVDIPSRMHGGELISRICKAVGITGWMVNATWDDDGDRICITLGSDTNIVAEFVGEYEVEDYDCDTYSDTECLPNGLDQVYGADTDLP